MKRLRLLKPVTIVGKDFFGRKAKTTFLPCLNPGWHWMCGNELIPITSDLVIGDQRRITLGHKKYRLEVYEHIGALRFTGLDHIAVQSSEWPPYFGRVSELWEALKPYCVRTEEEIPWINLKYEVSDFNLAVNGSYRSISLSPLENSLEMEVTADFIDFGCRTFNFRHPESLEDVFRAYTLGWPPFLFGVSKTFSKLKIWRHHDRMIWFQNNPRSCLLETATHRAADILGTLSLVTHDSLLAGRIVSFRGSHKLDRSVLKQVETQT